MILDLIKKYYYKWSLAADERIVLLLPPATLVVASAAPACLIAIADVLLVTRFYDYRTIFGAIPGLMRSPFAAAAGLFFLWAAASCFWSAEPTVSTMRLFTTLILIAITLFLLGVAATETLRDDRSMLFMSLAAVVCAVVTIVMIAFFVPMDIFWDIRITEYQFHRIAFVLALLLPFILTHRPFNPALRIVVGLCLLGAIFLSNNEAAKLAVLVGIASLVLASFAWRTAIVAVTLAMVLLTVFMPAVLVLLQSGIPADAIAMLGDAHAAERLEIWRQSVPLIPQRWLHGWGMETTRSVFDHIDAQTLQRLEIPIVDATHPHNQILQIWVELGIVGILLFCAALVAASHRICSMPPATKVATLSMTATLFAISAVSHGLWQSWWVALVCGLLVLVLALERRERQREGANAPRQTGAGA